MKKLEAWVGSWTIVAVEKSPDGKEEKFTGKVTGRMILDGAFLEERYEMQNESTKVMDKGMLLTGYDSETKSFVEHGFFKPGVTTRYSGTVDAKTRAMSAEAKNAEGKTAKGRSRRTLADDGKTTVSVFEEFKEDTNSWVPWLNVRATNVGH
jgi:hypothetical protein